MKKMIDNLCFLVLFWLFFVLVTLTRWFFTIFPVQQLKDRKKAKKVLYLAAFFPGNAGYHYRLQLWKEQLEIKGLTIKVKGIFRSQQHFDRLLARRNRFLIRGMWKRYWQLLGSFGCDRVIVRRSLLLYNEYGNLFFEKLLLTLHPAAILDFDDNMERSDANAHPGWYGILTMEKKDKFRRSLRLYKKFLVGSPVLKALVLNHHPQTSPPDILVVPTCVDYAKLPGKIYGNLPAIPTLGWIGSDGNQQYLDLITPALNELYREQPFRLKVISGKEYICPAALFPIVNEKWSLQTQVKELLEIDLGLMPLKDTLMERGKCGFKLIQYMGLGIVSLATPVGINEEIVTHGKDSFLVDDENQWKNALQTAFEQWKNFPEMSRAARKKIDVKYSFQAHSSRYLHFLEQLTTDD